MFCNVNNIKEKYETVKRDNRDIRIESVEIAESEVSYVEDLCHSMLGNMLQFGWQLGEKTDTPAIKLGLLYCGFLGMISKKNRLIEEGKSPEDLFKSICENGFNALDDSINMVLDLSSKDREKYNKLFDDISTDMVKSLPTIIDNPDKELACLDACLAMYFVGKGIVI